MSLQKIVRQFFTLLVFIFFTTESAQANVPMPFYNHGFNGGIPYGYGWYPTFFWPQIWNDWGYGNSNWAHLNNFGVAYWPTYRYVPTFAVISYGPSTDKIGMSWGQRDIHRARAVAQDYCAEADCKAVVWTRGGCAAVVVPTESSSSVELDPQQKHIYWGVDTTKENAKTRANEACQKHQESFGEKAGSCVDRAWVCTN